MPYILAWPATSPLLPPTFKSSDNTGVLVDTLIEVVLLSPHALSSVSLLFLLSFSLLFPLNISLFLVTFSPHSPLYLSLLSIYLSPSFFSLSPLFSLSYHYLLSLFPPRASLFLSYISLSCCFSSPLSSLSLSPLFLSLLSLS